MLGPWPTWMILFGSQQPLPRCAKCELWIVCEEYAHQYLTLASQNGWSSFLPAAAWYAIKLISVRFVLLTTLLTTLAHLFTLVTWWQHNYTTTKIFMVDEACLLVYLTALISHDIIFSNRIVLRCMVPNFGFYLMVIWIHLILHGERVFEPPSGCLIALTAIYYF